MISISSVRNQIRVHSPQHRSSHNRRPWSLGNDNTNSIIEFCKAVLFELTLNMPWICKTSTEDHSLFASVKENQPRRKTYFKLWALIAYKLSVLDLNKFNHSLQNRSEEYLHIITSPDCASRRINTDSPSYIDIKTFPSLSSYFSWVWFCSRSSFQRDGRDISKYLLKISAQSKPFMARSKLLTKSLPVFGSLGFGPSGS